MRNAGLLAAVLLLCASPLGYTPTTVEASQQVTLQTGFTPDKLDTPTTIEFGFHVHSTTPEHVPSPVTDVSLDLPAGMGLATSTLGLAECSPTTLLEQGPNGCPANAQVGIGTAHAEMAGEGEILTETATIHAFLGPPADENEQVLFYAEGTMPVAAQLLFPSQILPATGIYSGRLDTTIPLIPTWANGPDIAVTSFNSTIGPRGLTYYRHTHGEIVPFHPKGITVPEHCPHNGFPFAATFTFLDNTHATTTSTVPCPHH